jgi:hypothetical protein
MLQKTKLAVFYFMYEKLASLGCCKWLWFRSKRSKLILIKNLVYSQNDKYEFNLELNYEGTVTVVHTHYLAKRFAVQANLGLNPFAHKSNVNKTFLRSFGIGIKLTTTSIEEEVTGIEPEEDFEEYEFDKIYNQNIK